MCLILLEFFGCTHRSVYHDEWLRFCACWESVANGVTISSEKREGDTKRCVIGITAEGRGIMGRVIEGVAA